MYYNFKFLFRVPFSVGFDQIYACIYYIALANEFKQNVNEKTNNHSKLNLDIWNDTK